MSVTISGNEDTETDSFMMTIIVKDTKDFTATQLAHATALGVNEFVPLKQNVEPDSNWDKWLSARFGKILKRMKPNQFNKTTTELIESNIDYFSYSEGNVELIIVEPLRKSFRHPHLNRAQIAGLQVMDEQLPYVGMFGRAHIMLNTDLNMSPAKAAVAAAHALQLLQQELSETSQMQLMSWSRNRSTDVLWLPLEDHRNPVVTINDAGHTEVTPGSVTATAKMNGSSFLR